MDDEALAAAIRGAQHGQAGCFDRLVERFGGRVYGFLYRMTGSRSEAEDLAQEVFVRVVQGIGAYQHDGRFEAWLFRIAANLCRDRVRRLRRTPRHQSMGDAWDDEQETTGATGVVRSTSTNDGPASPMERREAVDALGRALEKLPDAERQVIMMRHFSQMSFKEIADAMQTPLGTALARAHRGLARLKELMGVEDGARGLRAEELR
jgi:RNA polymerase sigma-70 factor (ECF subfamily)